MGSYWGKSSQPSTVVSRSQYVKFKWVPADLKVAAIVITVRIDNNQSHRPFEDTVILKLEGCVSENTNPELIPKSSIPYLNVHPFLFLKALILAHEPGLCCQSRRHVYRSDRFHAKRLQIYLIIVFLGCSPLTGVAGSPMTGGYARYDERLNTV